MRNFGVPERIGCLPLLIDRFSRKRLLDLHRSSEFIRRFSYLSTQATRCNSIWSLIRLRVRIDEASKLIILKHVVDSITYLCLSFRMVSAEKQPASDFRRNAGARSQWITTTFEKQMYVSMWMWSPIQVLIGNTILFYVPSLPDLYEEILFLRFHLDANREATSIQI